MSDGGQNYIEFDIVDNFITRVRPALLAGWAMTKIKNLHFFVGGGLKIQLHNGYEFVLKHLIVDIKETLPEIILIQIAGGKTTEGLPYRLIDSGANFIAAGVEVGALVYKTADGTYTQVTKINSETDLSIDQNILLANEDYEIYE